jgi:membrane protein implicated in regulation of membrane protease activity
MAAIESASAIVLEQVDAEHGVVKIDGEVWTARAFDNTETFAPGARVRVVKVRGNTLFVWHDDTPYA